MKNTILSFLFLLPFLSQATVWRVDGATNLDADFSDLQEALDNASAGDTIYVAPNGGATYGAVTVTTPLTIIGSGYRLAINDSTQYFGAESALDYIIFGPGSSGSVLKGFGFVGFVNNYIGAPGNGDLDNCSIILDDCCLLIEKCRNKAGAGSIGFTFNADNCVVTKCLFASRNVRFELESTNSGSNSSYQPGTGIVGTLISNSVFGPFSGYSAGAEGILSLTVDRCLFTSNGVVNAFNGASIVAENTDFLNCIFLQAPPSGIPDYNPQGTNTFTNCLARINVLPEGTGNQNGVQILSIFDQAFAGIHPELQYSLSETSPARNAATDGGDIGIFGGPDPYVLSGMPDIPSIFQLSVDPSGDGATQSIGVNLKAKSHE